MNELTAIDVLIDSDDGGGWAGSSAAQGALFTETEADKP